MYFSNMPLTRKQKKEAAQKTTKVKVDKHSENSIIDDSKFEQLCQVFQDISQKIQGDKKLCKYLDFACARYDKLLSEKV